MQNFSVAIVGPREEVLCFRAVGVEIFGASDANSAIEILRKIKKSFGANEENSAKKFAVVFVIEEILQKIAPEELEKLSAGALPAIIALPGKKGASGAGLQKINRLVEKAIGSNIFEK